LPASAKRSTIWSNPRMVRCLASIGAPPSPVTLDELADAQALGTRRRTPHRLAAGAPGHDHDEVARLVDDRHHGVLIVLVDPDRKERPFRLASILDHSPRLAGHLEDRLLNVELLPAGRRDVLGILRSEDERRVALGIEVVAAIGRHR